MNNSWFTPVLETLRNAVCPWSPVLLRSIGEGDYADAISGLAKQPTAARVTLARFLLEETRRVVESKMASVRALEGKAMAQIGVAGTILAILTVFEKQIPAAVKLVPLSLLAIAILAYIQAGYIRSGSLPSVGHYLNSEVVGSDDNEAKIALALAAAWNEYGLELEQANLKKANFARAGNFWMQLALASILLVLLVSSRQRQDNFVTDGNTCTQTIDMIGVQHGRCTKAGAATYNAGTTKRPLQGGCKALQSTTRAEYPWVKIRTA